MKIKKIPIKLIHALLFCLFYFVGTSSWAAINSSPPSKGPVVVNIALFVDDISNINQENEIVELEMQLYLNWVDKRLAFKETPENSIQIYRNGAAEDKLKEIWVPPFNFEQSRGTLNTKGRELIITPHGEVTLVERVNGQIESRFDMRKYPFDKQNIVIRVTQFPFSESNIVYKNENKFQGFSSYAHLPEWVLLSHESKVTDHGKVYDFTVHYAHNYKFHIFRVFIPLFVITVLSWIVVWLPKEMLINRLQFVLTTLLATLIFEWVIFKDIPHVSYPTFFGEVLFFGFMMLGLTIIVLVMDHYLEQPLASSVLYHLRWFIPLFFFLVVCGLVIYNFAL